MRDLQTPLYLEIAESIRRLIASGELGPGDQLPTIREQAERLGCTAGTVSRAYAALAKEGLVVGRRGAGTKVTANALHAAPESWRWAILVNLAEQFLLEAVRGGHSPPQVEAALSVAIARWRELQSESIPTPSSAPRSGLRFVGSHDLVVELLPRMLQRHDPTASLQVKYVGSLGGLIALARSEADVAGIHLWDASSDSYNVPFVQRVLPGRSVALLTLFHRSLGLILPPGNPDRVRGLSDLARPEVCFVNRQPGSGTRVWLDAQLKTLSIPTEAVPGHDNVVLTHLEVAKAVAEGNATAGLGIQAAALSYGLAFCPLTLEQYDLLIPKEVWDTRSAQVLREVIRSPDFRESVMALGGYDLTATGKVTWVQ